MSFKKIYQEAINRAGYHKDDAQATMVEHLDLLYADLTMTPAPSGILRNGLAKAFRLGQRNKGIQGCYLSGGVGLGKTWLMDLFFNSVPIIKKSRFHFHEFMQRIHQELACQKQQRDPLKQIARSLVEQAELICLDEFHVLDITDAMLLYGLLDEMYRRGAVFVMTSNVMPDELYLNGLQRSRFLPAIELIKSRNRVCQFHGDKDYRMLKRAYNLNYYCPLTTDTDRILEERFNFLASGPISKTTALTINSRPIHVRAHAQNIVWFDFEEICGGPRATIDYIYLAQHYDFIIISNVFRLDEENNDIARRFINLIDELYDRNTGLIISAIAWPGDLYSGQRLAVEFARTVSRLQEIRSREISLLEVIGTKKIDKFARLP
ncbi:MAG: cell division protein ZapE [Gammaproteobacteria bacterium]|nr:cell division protein ZapE [Gammaproteobacteria bacterium]